jgi:RNA polymerase sigma-70 factor (ECF subfamily)
MTQSSQQGAPVPDTAWLIRFANGDPEAARVLSARLGPRAFRFAYRLLGDQADAEDIAQEALLRLWRQAPRWRQDGPAEPATWLLRVVRNLAIDRLRQVRQHNRAPEGGATLEQLADPAPSALAQLAQKERTAALEDALRGLPDRQREAVVLRHLEELGNPDIAAIMDISVEAVESLLSRGRRTIRDQLAGRQSELGYDDDTG